MFKNFKQFQGPLMVKILGGAFLYQWAAMIAFCWSEKLHLSEATPFAYVRYWLAYSSEEVVRSGLIKAAFMPLGTILLGWLLIEGMKPKPGVFGSARWATKSEMTKAKFFEKDGLHLGKVGKDLVRLGDSLHTLIQAQTGTMKSASIVIPNLLLFKGSAFVLDPKGELYKFTSWFRKYFFRNQIFVIDPFADSLTSHGFNPLDSIRVGHAGCVSDIDLIATRIWPQAGGDADEWAEMARGLFKALVLYLAESRKEALTLPAVFRASSGYGQGFAAYFSAEVAEHGDKMSVTTKAALDSILAQASGGKSNTFNSIMTVFAQKMSIFNNPVFEAIFSRTDFNFADIRKSRITIYFCASTTNQVASGVISRLLLGALNAQNETQLNSKPDIKHKVLLMLDEMALVGHSADVESILQVGRSRGLQVMGVLQNLSQARLAWGEEGLSILLGAMKVKMFFGLGEMKEAKEWCEFLGEYTAKNKSEGSSTSQDGSSTSTNTNQVQSQLVYPAELLYRDARKAVVLVRGLRPAEIDVAPWFEIESMWRQFGEKIPALKQAKDCPPQATWEKWANARRLAIDIPVLDIDPDKVPKVWQVNDSVAVAEPKKKTKEERKALIDGFRQKIREALSKRVRVISPDGEVLPLIPN